jgi:alpha/beta superfamily hydrolase
LKPQTAVRLLVDGKAGPLEVVVNEGLEAARGLALIAHPHPLHGGTMDNKVVHTLAKSVFALGYLPVRMNFRGVGGSAGLHDHGEGETQDWLAVLTAMHARYGELPVLLAGFSFGAYVQSRVARALIEGGRQPVALLLIAPAVDRFSVEQTDTDTLVVHGDVDDVVPLAEVFAWARPTQQAVTVLPGAGHFFHGYLPKLQHVVTRFCSAINHSR